MICAPGIPPRALPPATIIQPGVGNPAPAFTGGATAQPDMATVTSAVTVTGGVGPFTYARTLTAPDQTNQTALYASATAASTTWVPLAIPGVWVETVTVTDARGRTGAASRTVLLGDGSWLRVARFSFGSEADQLPGAIFASGLRLNNAAQGVGVNTDWTCVNTANDVAGGPQVLGGLLVLSPAAGTGYGTTTTTRTAPLLYVLAQTLLGTVTYSRPKSLRIVATFNAPTWTANTTDAFLLGVENNPGIGAAAATGGGVTGGVLKQAGGVRPRSTTQAGAVNALVTDTGVALGDAIRVIAVDLYGAQSGENRYSLVAADGNTAAAVSALAVQLREALSITTITAATTDWVPTAAARVVVCNQSPGAANGAVWNISQLDVYVDGPN